MVGGSNPSARKKHPSTFIGGGMFCYAVSVFANLSYSFSMRLVVSAFLGLLLLGGAGCRPPEVQPLPTQTEHYSGIYKNTSYGFQFSYDETHLQIRERPVEQQPTEYAGLPAQFFLSVQETVSEPKPFGVLYVYLLPNTSVDAFQKALPTSGKGIAIQKTVSYDQNGLRLTRVDSTTESQDVKQHYLIERPEGLVVFSPFLYQEDRLTPLFGSLRGI